MTSTFIVSINSDNSRNAYLGSILIAVSGNGTETPPDSLDSDMDSVTMTTLASLSLGLALSFISVFSAMLVKQWLKQCDLVDTKGTAADRCRDRQRKFDNIRPPRINLLIWALLYLVQLSFSLLTLATFTYLAGVNVIFAELFYIVPGLITTYSFLLSFKWVGACIKYFRSYKKDLPLPTTTPWLERASGQMHFISHSPDQALHESDTHCVSWVLQISVDRGVRLSALEHLATVGTLTGLSPTLVANCLYVFIDCVNILDNDVVVVRGLERLATASAISFFRTLSHLSVTNPESWVFEHVRKRYSTTFPLETNFRGLPFYYTLGAIHRLFNSDQEHGQRPEIEWRDYKPSGHEHARVSIALNGLALSEYRRSECREREREEEREKARARRWWRWKEGQGERERGEGRGKVPRWIIRFALHSLSLDPLPPTAVIVDCLSIVATDLGCDALVISASNERWVLTSPDGRIFLIEYQHTTRTACGSNNRETRDKD